jgi:DNA-directed RNA polymerase subunit RPC12/RpoP
VYRLLHIDVVVSINVAPHTVPFRILTGWLDTGPARDASRMRLYGVRKLSELDGQFWVHVRCPSCAHRSCFLARDLEVRLPMRLRLNADLDTLKDRMKCAECGARHPSVWSMSDPMDQEEQFDELV